jgi:hypothetical protein
MFDLSALTVPPAVPLAFSMHRSGRLAPRPSAFTSFATITITLTLVLRVIRDCTLPSPFLIPPQTPPGPLVAHDGEQHTERVELCHDFQQDPKEIVSRAVTLVAGKKKDAHGGADNVCQ